MSPPISMRACRFFRSAVITSSDSGAGCSGSDAYEDSGSVIARRRIAENGIFDPRRTQAEPARPGAVGRTMATENRASSAQIALVSLRWNGEPLAAQLAR